MEETLRFLSFSEPNVRFVVLGSIILGATAAIVGSFAFLRKRALIGDAISHSILPGVALAFMLSNVKNPLYLIIGALISGWISLLLIDAIARTTKLKSDAAIAIILSVFFGFGIVLLTHIQQSGSASQSGLDHFLFGNAVSLMPQAILIFSSIGIFLILVVLLFFKEFKLLSFDIAYAKSIGLPIRFLEFCLSTITVLAVAVGIQAVGVVLMAALLITPAAGARFWTDNLKKMILIATAFGIFSAFIATYISYIAPSMPTGPWVVVVLSVLAVFSIWFAPKKGLVARHKVRRGNRRKILNENILKLFYHLGEEDESFMQGRSEEDLMAGRDFLPKQLKIGLKRLKHKSLIRQKGNNYIITQNGFNEAKRVIRLHRLWEMYLNQRLKLEAEHVHNDAEAIEHIINDEIERQLEKDLSYPDFDPHQSKIPKYDK